MSAGWLRDGGSAVKQGSWVLERDQKAPFHRFTEGEEGITHRLPCWRGDQVVRVMMVLLPAGGGAVHPPSGETDGRGGERLGGDVKEGGGGRERERGERLSAGGERERGSG